MTDRGKIIKEVIKECFWDYDITKEDIEKILLSDNKREKQWLFSKIMYNSKDKMTALKNLFSKKQLKELFADFKITYKHKYITKHCLILKYLLLGEKSYIKGVEWGEK